MVIVLSSSLVRNVRYSRSQIDRRLVKLESVSNRSTEWCTRCMFGVTITVRNARSHLSGTARLLW